MKNKDNVCWWYVLALFIPSYLLQLAIYLTGGLFSPFFSPLVELLMWFPAIVAIIFRLLTKEGFKNVGWGIRRWWYIFFALLVPPTVIWSVVLLIDALKWGTPSNQMLSFMQSIPFFVSKFIVPIILGSHINSTLTFGEEFGWRGYLLEKLLRKFDLNTGLLISGLIWGYWHMPIILMGYNFPDYPILGALLLMPLLTTFMGIFEAWLYLRSQSIWMPVLAHASINAASGFLYEGVAMTSSNLLRYGTWLTVWAIVAMLCLASLNRNKPVLWQENIKPDENSTT